MNLPNLLMRAARSFGDRPAVFDGELQPGSRGAADAQQSGLF
jgi:hypothetical protein